MLDLGYAERWRRKAVDSGFEEVVGKVEGLDGWLRYYGGCGRGSGFGFDWSCGTGGMGFAILFQIVSVDPVPTINVLGCKFQFR